MTTKAAEKNTEAKAASKAVKLSADVYSAAGKKTGSVDLPAAVFGVAWNEALIHQVVVGMQANARTPVAHAHDRGEQRGGGKKPWKQKGTGRARHGSRRSPIWRGGGVTHGPTNEKDYSKVIPKKMRAKALAVALSQKARDGQIIFVDALSFEAPKTAEAKGVLAALGKAFEGLATKRKNAALLATSSYDTNTVKSFSNIGSIEVEEVRNLNPVEVLQHQYLIIAGPEEALKTLESRIASKKA